MFKETTSVSYKEIWRLSRPIIAGSAIENIINLTDTAFLGHLNQVALGAAAIGGIFYLTFVMLGWGFGIGTQIIIARRFGEGKYNEIGKILQHAAYFLFPLGLLVLVAVLAGKNYFFGHFIHSQDVSSAVNEFITYRVFGIFFSYTNVLFKAFYIGTFRTKVIGYCSAFVAIINIILGYALIFGHFGCPAMGIGGAALASVIAEASGVLFYSVFMMKRINLSKFGLAVRYKFEFSALKSVFKTASPVMMQFFLSFSAWFILFLLIERLGETSLAISNIARSLYSFILLPLWGYASAANTLVSYKIGKKEINEVIPVIRKIMGLSFVTTMGMIVLCMFFGPYILNFYTNDQVLINGSWPVLYVTFVSALLLSVSIVMFNGVSGIGRTLVTLIMEAIVISAYLVWALMVVNVFKGNVTIVWFSETVYGIFMILLSVLYLNFSNWRSNTQI